MKRTKLIRCTCCKNKGHFTHQCPKDPNLRYEYDAEEELMRIFKLGGGEDNRSYDSLKLTSHFLTFCNQNKLKTPFAEGCMEFDDFNYRYYNSAVFTNKTELKTTDQFRSQSEIDDDKMKANIATTEFEDFDFFKESSSEYDSEIREEFDSNEEEKEPISQKVMLKFIL